MVRRKFIEALTITAAGLAGAIGRVGGAGLEDHHLSGLRGQMRQIQGARAQGLRVALPPLRGNLPLDG